MKKLLLLLLCALLLTSCASSNMNACWGSNGKTKNGLYK